MVVSSSSILPSKASTMMTKTNRPAIAGTKYWSAVDAGCGVAVAAAGIFNHECTLSE